LHGNLGQIFVDEKQISDQVCLPIGIVQIHTPDPSKLICYLIEAIDGLDNIHPSS